MQEYQAFLESLRFPFLYVTAGFALYILLSKAGWLVKALVLFTILYANLMIFLSSEIREILGVGLLQSTAIICFSVAALGLAFSIFRFLKASVTIVCWLLVAAVIGLTAFPTALNFEHISEKWTSDLKLDSRAIIAYLESLKAQR